MGLLTFSGGIHPYDGKELSKDKAITVYLPKGDAVYPLSQHIGAPANPIVKRAIKFWWGRRLQKRVDLYPRIFTLVCLERLRQLNHE